MLKSLKWEDWAGIALGLWLLASPWITGYAANAAAATNALVMGAALICLELLNLDAHDELEEWLDIVAGAWLVLAPFALGFAQIGAAAINAAGVGALTIVLAAWALSPLDARLASWWHGHIAHR